MSIQSFRGSILLFSMTNYEKCSLLLGLDDANLAVESQQAI